MLPSRRKTKLEPIDAQTVVRGDVCSRAAYATVTTAHKDIVGKKCRLSFAAIVLGNRCLRSRVERETDIALQVVAARKIQHFFRHLVSSKPLTVYFVLVKPTAEEVACDVASVVSMTAHSIVQKVSGDNEEETDVGPLDSFDLDCQVLLS
uniref:Uncharacterized protein n=1 Tax=Glossina austeni TaxID=7395 RepID=A0A1A9UHM4_GLOAU